MTNTIAIKLLSIQTSALWSNVSDKTFSKVLLCAPEPNQHASHWLRVLRFQFNMVERLWTNLNFNFPERNIVSMYSNNPLTFERSKLICKVRVFVCKALLTTTWDILPAFLVFFTHNNCFRNSAYRTADFNKYSPRIYQTYSIW